MALLPGSSSPAMGGQPFRPKGRVGFDMACHPEAIIPPEGCILLLTSDHRPAEPASRRGRESMAVTRALIGGAAVRRVGDHLVHIGLSGPLVLPLPNDACSTSAALFSGVHWHHLHRSCDVRIQVDYHLRSQGWTAVEGIPYRVWRDYGHPMK